MSVTGNKFKNVLAGYQTRSVPTALETAFDRMRDRGIVTNMGAGCCNGCTQGSLADQVHEMEEYGDVAGYAYFTEQNEYAVGDVAIGYSDIQKSHDDAPSKHEVGEIIADCLDEAGVEYYWENRSANKKILTGDRAYGDAISGRAANHIIQETRGLLDRMGASLLDYRLTPYFGGDYRLELELPAGVDLEEFEIRFHERFGVRPSLRERTEYTWVKVNGHLRDLDNIDKTARDSFEN